MGASPDVQDVFVQVDYLTGADGHSHLPAKTALQAVATALRNAGPRPSEVARGACLSSAAAGQCPINVHFDVGANDQPSGTFNPASCSLGEHLDRGLRDRPCRAGQGRERHPRDPVLGRGPHPSGAACAFPGFPGVVGWKSGFRAYRDAPVDRSQGGLACSAGQAGCEPRMPRTRKDVFHYALFAHALGYGSPRSRSSRGRPPASPIRPAAISW